MRTKIFGSLAVIAIAAVAAFNVNFNMQNERLSGISLENVEALAQSESGDRYGKYNMLRDCCGNSGFGYCYKNGWEC